MSKASATKEACVAVNDFLRDCFPNGKWTFLAVILNSHIGFHRDIGNMINMPNCAIALGGFAGGKVWIEDEQGTSLDEVVMKNKIHQLRRSWLTCTTIQCHSTRVGQAT